MLAELLPAALLTRAVVLGQPIHRTFIERLVDFLLTSAKHRPEQSGEGGTAAPRSAPSSATRRE